MPRFTFQSIPPDSAVEHLPWLQSEKEKGRVVGYRRHVVRVARRKGPRILAANQFGKRRMRHPGLPAVTGRYSTCKLRFASPGVVALDVCAARRAALPL